MKVGVYANLRDELFIDTLKANKNITDVHEINSKNLKAEFSQGKTIFKFNEFELSKESLDLLIFRGGFSDVLGCLQLIKFCHKNDIKVFDNNLHTVRYFINKKVDTLNFALNNLPIPKTYFFNDLDVAKSTDLQFPLIFKVVNAGKGANVYKVESFKKVEEILIKTEKDIKSYMFQEFIDYVHDLRIFVLGEKVLGVMKRIPGEGEFRANFSLGGDVEVFEASEEIKDLAVKAAKACEADIAGIDILVDKEGKLFVLEANRTPGVEGISKALGFNVAEKVIDYILEKTK